MKRWSFLKAVCVIILFSNTRFFINFMEAENVKEETYFYVDLKNFLNWSYDHTETQARWIGCHPEMDIADIPKGNVKFSEIPFYIYSPDEKTGDCIICVGYSMHQLMLLKVALKIGPIPVKRKADRLFFLHSAGWLYTKKPIGIYRIIYEDGKQEEIRIRKEYEIDDWYYTDQNTKLAKGKVVWTTILKKWNKEVGICMLTWENPYPEKEIKEIIIEGSPYAQLFVLAITGMKNTK